MQVILDEREGALFDKCRSLIDSKYVSSITSVSKEVLCLGDIVFRDEDGIDTIILERKSLRDLLASIRDSRYDEQSYRLTHASGLHPHKIIYIIEGVMSTLKSDVEKKTVYSAISSLNLFKGFSVIRTSSVSETAEVVLSMADKINRNVKRKLFLWKPTSMPIPNLTLNGGVSKLDDAVINTIVSSSEKEPEHSPANYCTVVKKVRKENITTDNFGEILLSQIPGVSSISAIAIMKHYTSLIHLIESIKENENCLDGITIDTNGKSRKIGKNIVSNIKKFLSSGEKQETALAETLPSVLPEFHH